MKQKMVIKIQRRSGSKWFSWGRILRKFDSIFEGEGFQTKVLKKIAETHGLISVAMEGDDKVVVVGDSIDATKLTSCLRKKVAHATLLSLEEVKEKKEEPKVEPIPIAWTPPPTPIYYVCHC